MSKSITVSLKELDALIAERVTAVLAADPDRFRGEVGYQGPMGMSGDSAASADLQELRRYVDARFDGVHPTVAEGML